MTLSGAREELPLEQAMLRKRKTAAVAHDEVAEQPEVHERQGLWQPRCNRSTRPHLQLTASEPLLKVSFAPSQDLTAIKRDRRQSVRM